MPKEKDEYVRISSTLSPRLNDFLKNEAERRKTSQRQIIEDSLNFYQKVIESERVVDVLGDEFRDYVAVEFKNGFKQIQREIHDTLFKSFYKALKEKFSLNESISVSSNLILNEILTDKYPDQDLQQIHAKYRKMATKYLQNYENLKTKANGERE